VSWRQQMMERYEAGYVMHGFTAQDEFDDRMSRWASTAPPRFQHATPETLEGPAAEAFEEWRQSNGTRNVLFLGPVGTGKTHAAYAFLCHVHMCGVWRWTGTSSVSLMDKLRPGGDERLGKWTDVDCLLLDDLGGEKPSEWVAERLFALIDERWRWERPTLVTTNLLPGQLREALGDRTYSRLQDEAIAVTLTGRDRRRAA
jgi:DNA replication protein DnaC